MPMRPTRQACPSCQSAGLVKHPRLEPDEALICPHCLGRGWQVCTVRAFDPAAKIAGITRVYRHLASHAPASESDTPTSMTLEEFHKRYRLPDPTSPPAVQADAIDSRSSSAL